MIEVGATGPMGEDRWAQALIWYVTLRDGGTRDLNNAVGRKWEQWYSDAENRRIFDDLSRLQAERNLYRMRSRPTNAELTDDRYDLSVPIAEWNKRDTRIGIANRRTRERNRWWWLCGGVGVAAIAVLFSFLPQAFGPDTNQAGYRVYETDIGGLRDVHLSDGSSIILGGRTKLSVAFSPQRRSVELFDGQAWFRVAHDLRWPFAVAAGHTTVRDIGTAFLVTRESNRVVVTVTQGVVEVSALSPMRPSFTRNSHPLLAPIHVSAGEELALSDNGVLSAITQADTHASIAWIHGRLTFDNQPLRYVVETLDRYSSRHIAVSPSVGAFRFSGVVFADEIEDWLQSLKAILPIAVKEQGAEVEIEMRHPAQVTRGTTPKT